jgi:hypothetical protein
MLNWIKVENIKVNIERMEMSPSKVEPSILFREYFGMSAVCLFSGRDLSR